MAWYDGEDTTLVEGNPSKSDSYAFSDASSTVFGSPEFNMGSLGSYRPEDVEPKLSYRFRVRFGVFDAVGQHVKTYKKPNVTFAEVEVPKLNTKVYFAGRKAHDDVSIALDDSLDGDTTKACQTQLEKQANFNNNYHAFSAGSYFFNIVCEELSGDGTALMAWYNHKCVLTGCDFGQLDYSADNTASEISLTIKYSNFTTWLGKTGRLPAAK